VHIFKRLKILFTIKESPKKLAMSFSIGLFIGLSPLLGLHTILSIIVASVFRLNKLVTLMGTYVTNPWSLMPIYAFCTWVGMKLTGTSDVLKTLNFHEITIFNLFGILKNLLLPFIVGTITVGFVSSFLAYWIIFYLVTRFREVS